MLSILLADAFYVNTIKMMHQSIIIMECSHLCPFNDNFVMENRCYGGIATGEHFTYHKPFTIDFDCYSFLFISKKPSYKEIRPLSTFRGACFLNISVREAYIYETCHFGYCPVCNVFE